MQLEEFFLTSYLKFGIIAKVTILPMYTNAIMMTSPKLNDLKKELQHLDVNRLKDVCLKLAKHKVENKELLNYLLFYEDAKDEYINNIKGIIISEFDDLHPSIYYVKKQLSKLIRIMNKHIKFIGEKDKEIEIILCFCDEFIKHPIVKAGYKALSLMLYRQLKRANKIIPKLNDDLQFDYQNIFNELVTTLKKKDSQFSIWDIT
jgi:uncharacterized FlaG/YvyC family protein